MIPFCDNALCPNSLLEMNDERHYHSTDVGAVGGICGILKSHKVGVKVPDGRPRYKILPYKKIQDYKLKNYNLCDNCHNVYRLLKE